MARSSVWSAMTARILLRKRMGEPLVFLDLRFLRVVSWRDCLVDLLVGDLSVCMYGSELTMSGRNGLCRSSETLPT